MLRVHRVWSFLQPRRPRHPVVRLLLGLFAVCVFSLLLIVGAVVGMALLASSMLLRAFRPSRPSPNLARANDAPIRIEGDAIDGEFSVLRQPAQRTANR